MLLGGRLNKSLRFFVAGRSEESAASDSSGSSTGSCASGSVDMAPGILGDRVEVRQGGPNVGSYTPTEPSDILPDLRPDPNFEDRFLDFGIVLGAQFVRVQRHQILNGFPKLLKVFTTLKTATDLGFANFVGGGHSKIPSVPDSRPCS